MVDKEHQMIKQVYINLIIWLFSIYFWRYRKTWNGVNNSDQDCMRVIQKVLSFTQI